MDGSYNSDSNIYSTDEKNDVDKKSWEWYNNIYFSIKFIFSIKVTIHRKNAIAFFLLIEFIFFASINFSKHFVYENIRIRYAQRRNILRDMLWNIWNFDILY